CNGKESRESVMFAGLKLGQQLFDGPLFSANFSMNAVTIYDRVITRYRPPRGRRASGPEFLIDSKHGGSQKIASLVKQKPLAINLVQIIALWLSVFDSAAWAHLFSYSTVCSPNELLHIAFTQAD